MRQRYITSFLGGNFRSGVNAIAVDSAGRAFVAGSTCSSNFPTTRSAVLEKAPGSDKIDACDGFVAWLSAQGSRLEYGTYLGGSREDAATAVALAPDGSVIYVGGYTSSSDFPITGTAAQPKLNGLSNGFLSAIDVRSGQLLYSTYLGGTGADWVTGIAVALDGAVYVAGVTQSKNWPKRIQQLLSVLTNLAHEPGPVVVVHPCRGAERTCSDREVRRGSSAHHVCVPNAVNRDPGDAVLIATS
jgi:Beta-propeller repeat